jgi:predicted solute-binding protein
MSKMSIAFSPCPNDTFVFHALVHGLVSGAPVLGLQILMLHMQILILQTA